ncbi:MAG: oligosaccharide flippase family protein [Muribaculaceae bacterium]|nr:oligosaccharide flippase family protein [Muribaculaceae bacterium]
MATITSNSKSLAKNTFLLYMRTLLTMVVSLFTSRVVLNTLGFDDYGIYNIVGGFVSMFSILSGVLVSSTQRFMNFELGKKRNSRSYEIFGTAMGIHLGLALLLFLLFETFGLWFINSKLNIPVDRLYAANWVFQCSLITFIVNVLSAPYNATIIAHEKMSFFAYISLLEVCLKLGVAYALYISGFDKLIIYGILLMFIAILIRSIYSSYCTKHFYETKFHISREKSLYKEMTGFASMTFLGRFASILSNQGVNIILNVFFGVTVNAARGIAVQINSAVVKFVTDFTTALNPQITKKYAAGEKDSMIRLCCTGSKISFFLLLLFAVPIIMRTPYILEIWLKTYPVDTIIFVRLTLVISLFTVLSNPLVTGILATGNITKMCLTIGTIHLLTLPLNYLVLYLGLPSYGVYFVALGIEILLLFTRLIILSKLIKISIFVYVKEVVFRIVPVAIISFGFAYYINNCINNTLVGFILISLLTLFVSVSIIFLIGLNQKEKGMIVALIKSKIRRWYE